MILHFPQYVFFITLHHKPVTGQSSLGDLFGSLCQSSPSDVFVPGFVEMNTKIIAKLWILMDVRHISSYIVHPVSEASIQYDVGIMWRSTDCGVIVDIPVCVDVKPATDHPCVSCW